MKIIAIGTILAILSSVNTWSVTLDSQADVESFCSGNLLIY